MPTCGAAIPMPFLSFTNCNRSFRKDWEGCLSVPGVRALVPRNTSIKVRFSSRLADVVEAEYSGFLARIFQHEFDHLEGKVFLDRVENSHEVMMEQEWLKMLNQSL